MKEKRFALFLLFLIVLNCLLPILDSVNGFQVGTINAIQSKTPIIDGYIDPIEWKDAQPKSIILYSPINQLYIRDLLVYTIFDESDLLYIAILLSESVILDNELMIYFETNAFLPIIDSISLTRINWNPDQDVKWISIGNYSNDMVTVTNGIDSDDIHLGTTDFDGKCIVSDNVISLEMVMPLNSQDTNGHDPSLGLNDEINVFLKYESDVVYSQVRWEQYEWDYFTLHIGPSTTNSIKWLSLVMTTFGLMATSLVMIFLKTKLK